MVIFLLICYMATLIAVPDAWESMGYAFMAFYIVFRICLISGGVSGADQTNEILTRESIRNLNK